VIQVWLRPAQPLPILARAMSPNKRIRIFAFVHYDYIDVELFSYQQLAGPGGRALPGRIRIETKNDALGKTVQQPSLLGRQGRPTGRQGRGGPGLEYLGEIEIALY